MVRSSTLAAATASCPEDVDGSGDVGFDDLLAIITRFGQVGP